MGDLACLIIFCIMVAEMNVYFLYLGGCMKKIIVSAMVFLISTVGLIAAATAANTTSLSSLGSAFKTKKHADASIIIKSDEITMGYAGEDVANRLLLPVDIVA